MNFQKIIQVYSPVIFWCRDSEGAKRREPVLGKRRQLIAYRINPASLCGAGAPSQLRGWSTGTHFRVRMTNIGIDQFFGV